jgi:hypothetical protein
MDTPRRKQPFFRWFIITWPLVAFILAVIWAWLFYAFAIFSILYLVFPLLKKIWHKIRNNPTRATITFVMIISTIATCYILFMAEMNSRAIQSEGAWYIDLYASWLYLTFNYALAFQRIVMIWMIGGCWSVYLGLRNKIK